MNSLVLLLIAFLGVSCTKKEKEVDTAAAKGILLLANGAEPQDLDPQIVTGVPEGAITAALFEGLTSLNPNTLEPQAGVAESWTISPDQKVYTFKIRANAKWSDGSPLTAKDFVWAWQRMLTPELASEYSYMLHYLKNAKAFNEGKIKDFAEVGVKATDDATLVVTLDHPTSFFLSILAHQSTYPVKKETIEKFGKMGDRGTKWTRPGNLVGNGAFKLKSWELNKTIEVEKNPNYWDAANVKLSEIHFSPVDNDDTVEKNFRSGRLHITSSIPSAKIDSYKEKNPELLVLQPYLGTYYYRLNTKVKPLDNVKVRRALAMAINRDEIVKYVTKGGQIPAFAMTPPNTAGYNPPVLLDYNVEHAKQLLAEAGYPDGKGFPSLEILYNTLQDHKNIAEAIQQMWKKNLNIDVKLLNQDWKVYLATVNSEKYQVARAGWIGDYPDPNTFLDMWISNGGNNKTGFSSKAYDEKIDTAQKTLDREQRYKIFQEAEKILMEEVPAIPIYTYTRVYLKDPMVKGWADNILDYQLYKNVYLEKAKQ